MKKQKKTAMTHSLRTKKAVVLIFSISILFSLLLTGCGKNSSTQFTGKWEKTSNPNQTTNLTGYEFADDGTLTLYTGYDQNLSITEYDWRIDESNKTLLDVDNRDNQSEHQQIRFFIEGENLYLSFDLKDSKTNAMTQENQYIKTDSFSFEELIPDAELAKDKDAKDALIHCSLAPEEIIQELKNRGLSIGNVVVYSNEAVEKQLLSQPNKQLAKAAHFEDTTVEQNPNETEPIGGSVEVFADYAVAKQRYDYLSVFHEETGYTYQSGNVLVRVDHDISPDNAIKYEQALYEIVK